MAKDEEGLPLETEPQIFKMCVTPYLSHTPEGSCVFK